MTGAKAAEIARIADQQPEILQQPALQFFCCSAGRITKNEMGVPGSCCYSHLLQLLLEEVFIF